MESFCRESHFTWILGRHYDYKFIQLGTCSYMHAWCQTASGWTKQLLQHQCSYIQYSYNQDFLVAMKQLSSGIANIDAFHTYLYIYMQLQLAVCICILLYKVYICMHTYTAGLHDMHACMVMSYKYSQLYIDTYNIVQLYMHAAMHMESTLIPHLAAISCNEIVNYG